MAGSDDLPAVPDGFIRTDDDVEAQVRCESCGCMCTVGVEYGEQAVSHGCPGDRPRFEEGGMPAPGF